MARTDQRAIPLALIAIAAALVIARFGCSPRETASTAPLQSRGPIQWMTPEAGIALAKETGKPVVFDFTAEWCGPCHLLDEQVFSDASIAADINKRFIPIRVTDRLREEGKNPPAVAELEQRYAVRGFPTVIFADAGGTELARMEGFRGPDGFRRVMESVR